MRSPAFRLAFGLVGVCVLVYGLAVLAGLSERPWWADPWARRWLPQAGSNEGREWIACGISFVGIAIVASDLWRYRPRGALRWTLGALGVSAILYTGVLVAEAATRRARFEGESERRSVSSPVLNLPLLFIILACGLALLAFAAWPARRSRVPPGISPGRELDRIFR